MGQWLGISRRASGDVDNILLQRVVVTHMGIKKSFCDKSLNYMYIILFKNYRDQRITLAALV